MTLDEVQEKWDAEVQVEEMVGVGTVGVRVGLPDGTGLFMSVGGMYRPVNAVLGAVDAALTALGKEGE